MAHFWAPWSQPSVDMCSVVEVMAEEYPAVQFLKVCFRNTTLNFDYVEVA